MSVEIDWLPNPETDVTTYILQKAATASGPWVTVATIENVRSGPYYDDVNGTFQYVDESGTSSDWYHLIAVDTIGLPSAPSAPFQLAQSPTVDARQTKVTPDFGGAGELKYVTQAGVPVDGAIVRVYKELDYAAGSADPVAITVTQADGTWRDALFLSTGYTYIIQFAKEGQFGPDSRRISVI